MQYCTRENNCDPQAQYKWTPCEVACQVSMRQEGDEPPNPIDYSECMDACNADKKKKKMKMMKN